MKGVILILWSVFTWKVRIYLGEGDKPIFAGFWWVLLILSFAVQVVGSLIREHFIDRIHITWQ